MTTETSNLNLKICVCGRTILPGHECEVTLRAERERLMDDLTAARLHGVRGLEALGDALHAQYVRATAAEAARARSEAACAAMRAAADGLVAVVSNAAEYSVSDADQAAARVALARWQAVRGEE